MVHSHGCLWEALVPYCMNLSTVLFECPHDKAVGFPVSRLSRRKQGQSYMPSEALGQKSHMVTPAPLEVSH